MSLNKTLDRLFDEIRREAKRNPDFANRLDAVLRLHDSRRDVPDEVTEDVVSFPARGESVAREARDEGGIVLPPQSPSPTAAPQAGGQHAAFNPIALYQREGETGLHKALEGQALPALQALVQEHNLDPTGEAGDFDRDALVAHVLAQAKRRAERDAKLFDY
jgi:hypothetical protein